MATFEDELDEAMTQVRAARDGLTAVQDQVLNARATVRSRNRVLSATVDAQGRLTALTLHGDGYRTMAAAELCSLVVDTVAEAHRRCSREVTDVLESTLGDDYGAFDPSAPLGASYDELFTRTILDRLPGLSEVEADEVRRSWQERS